MTNLLKQLIDFDKRKEHFQYTHICFAYNILDNAQNSSEFTARALAARETHSAI